MSLLTVHFGDGQDNIMTILSLKTSWEYSHSCVGYFSVKYFILSIIIFMIHLKRDKTQNISLFIFGLSHDLQASKINLRNIKGVLQDFPPQQPPTYLMV